MVVDVEVELLVELLVEPGASLNMGQTMGKAEKICDLIQKDRDFELVSSGQEWQRRIPILKKLPFEPMIHHLKHLKDVKADTSILPTSSSIGASNVVVAVVPMKLLEGTKSHCLGHSANQQRDLTSNL